MNQRKVIGIFWLLLATVSLHCEDAKRLSIVETEGNSGKRWAICIGIDDYEDSSILDLHKAGNDARTMGAVLKDNGQFDYVYVMTDDLSPRDENYPKRRNIMGRLDFIKEFIRPDDMMVFFFSGHGVSDAQGAGFLVAVDAVDEELFETSVSVNEVVAALGETGITKSLLMIDACREYFQENKGLNQDGLYAEKYERAEVAATFFATKQGWYSYEDSDSEYGVFSRYLIGGLQGSADSPEYEGNEDGIVTFSELADYVEAGVSEWAIEHSKKQKPYTEIYGEKSGDLALSAYVGGAGGDDNEEEPEPPGELYGELYIVTEPDGAVISIDGEEKVGNPFWLKEVFLGRQLAIEARLGNIYKSEEITLDREGLNDITLFLEIERGNLIISSAEKNVEVFISGESLGGFGSGLFRDIPVGESAIELRGDGLYWKGEVAILSDETTEVRADVGEVGEISYAVPSGARAILAGTGFRETVRGGGTLRNMPVGRYRATVTGSGYRDETIEISLQKGAEFSLEPYRTGSVRVESTPSGAGVYVDGVYAGRTPVTVAEVEKGYRTVEVKLDGYKESSRRVLVIEGKTATGAFAMKQAMPSGFVLVEDGEIAGSADSLKSGRPNNEPDPFPQEKVHFNEVLSLGGYFDTANRLKSGLSDDSWEVSKSVSIRGQLYVVQIKYRTFTLTEFKGGRPIGKPNQNNR